MKTSEGQFSGSLSESKLTFKELETIENPIVRKITIGMLMEMSNPTFIAGAFGENGQSPTEAYASSFGEGGNVPRQAASFGEGGNVPRQTASSGQGGTKTVVSSSFGEMGTKPVSEKQ